MRKQPLWMVAALSVGGCASGPPSGVVMPPSGSGSVIVTDVATEDGRGGEGERARSPGEVPRGHYPPPGECRIWFVNRPPGQQPPPERCDRLVGRVPYGAFLLYADEAWDTEVDWRRESVRRPGMVPDVVLRIMTTLVRGRG